MAQLIQAEEQKRKGKKEKTIPLLTIWNAMFQRQQSVKNVVEPALLRYKVKKGLIAVNKNVQSQLLDEA